MIRKAQAGALDIMLFIILVMTAIILLFQTSGKFLNSVWDNMNTQLITLKLKQIFVTMISLKKNDKNFVYQFSYIYLKNKVCSGQKTIKDFFDYVKTNYSVDLVEEIRKSIGYGTVLIYICGQCAVIDQNIYSLCSFDQTFSDLSKKSSKVVVYQADVFGNENDFRIYYFG